MTNRLNQWQILFMHDNRNEVERCVEDIDKWVQELSSALDKEEELSEDFRHSYPKFIMYIRDNLWAWKENLAKFEEAMIRGGRRADKPDLSVWASVPNDYMLGNEAPDDNEEEKEENE